MSAGRIALGYAVIGILWIAFSDAFVTHFRLPPAVMTMKGTVFVLVTASLLYFAIRRLVQAVRLTTLELRQSESYLAEAQRLSHTGSWARELASGGSDVWSEEMFRIYGFDPQQGVPARETLLRRIHPEDRNRWQEGFDKAVHQKVDTFDEYRVVLADGMVKHIHAVRHPVLNDAGEVVKIVGTSVDITERKHAEEALRESEKRFSTIVNHAGDALFIYDFEAQTLADVSQRACESLGYTREELIGKEPHFFHDNSYHVGTDSIVKRTAAGETVFDTHWHQRKDGTRFPVEVHTSLVSYGGRRYLLKVARDISDRLKAEQTLRQSEAYLSEAQRLSHTGSWAWDVVAGRPDYWSEEMFRIFGFDPRDSIPPLENFIQRIHPEDQRRVETKFQQVFQETVDQIDEFRFLMADGSVKYIHSTAHPLPNETGEIVKVVGSMMDITERKRAEAALQRSEAYLAEAQKLSHTGSWALDLATGKYDYVSEENFRIFGFEPKETAPSFEAWFRRICPEDQARMNAAHEKMLREKADTSDEFGYRLPDGTIKQIHLIRHPVLNKAGDVVQIMGTAVDITERKKAEQRLQAFQEELQQLTRYQNKAREEERTAIARDLHDELGQQLSILTIDLAGLESRLPKQQDGLAATLQEINQRLDDAIRTVQRLATGLRPALLDDLGLVAAIQWQAKDFTKRTGIPTELAVPKENVKLDRDLSTALFRIFQESLTNVARHAQASRVTVHLDEGKNGISLEIIDNGRGIRQSEASASSSLGLIGMRERLRPWMGSVEVAGRDGKGTIVRVQVPLEPVCDGSSISAASGSERL